MWVRRRIFDRIHCNQPCRRQGKRNGLLWTDRQGLHGAILMNLFKSHRILYRILVALCAAAYMWPQIKDVLATVVGTYAALYWVETLVIGCVNYLEVSVKGIK